VLLANERGDLPRNQQLFLGQTRCFFPTAMMFCHWLSLSLAVSAAPAPPPRPPHIVLNIIDDLGWYNVGYHGNSECVTPNLDELARTGVTLDRMYTYRYW
jgi:hypothetical protein